MLDINEIRKLIKANSYPPIFEPALWFRNCPRANCYPYALDLKINQPMLVGDMIQKRVKQCFCREDFNHFFQVFEEELDTIGLKIVDRMEDNAVGLKGDLKICILFLYTGDYHFVRQDLDEIWSLKGTGSSPRNSWRDEEGDKYPLKGPVNPNQKNVNLMACVGISKK